MALPEELKRAFPCYGPGWAAAIERGIDVSLILENLALTPTQRLAQLEAFLNELDALKAAAKPLPLSERACGSPAQR